MRIHFVYVGGIDNENNYAPYTITRYLGRFLRSTGVEVIYYDWDQIVSDPDVRSDDIIIGHPHYNGGTAVRSLWSKECKAKFLIHPFHHAMPHLNLPFDDLAKSATGILSISGPYWVDTIGQSVFAHWGPKITRLDMAVDSVQFPLLKKTFNNPGRRVFAYIGRSEPEKGTDILAAMFARSSNLTLHCYGSIGGELANLSNVVNHGWTHICTPWAVDLCNMVDFVISAGRSDANPTSLLEGAAWGLVPLATRECGYWPSAWRDSQIFVGGFDGSNIDDGVRVLSEYNNMSSSILVDISTRNRAIVELHYTWSRFCASVWKTIKDYVK